MEVPEETLTSPPFTVDLTPSKVTVVRAWTAKFSHKLWESDSKLGAEDGLVLGRPLGDVLGEALGSGLQFTVTVTVAVEVSPSASVMVYV
jgi:hypothetical protein